MSSPTVIEARALSAGYGSLAAVRDVNLRVDAGEVVALLGPNGAGKSTLLKTLAGILTPLSGQVLRNGTVTRAPLHRRARDGLGYVSEGRSVFMGLTAAENLRLGGGSPRVALELFPGLEAHLGRPAGLLSGGQQQMLTVARALAAGPEVLLADELSLGLAPQIVGSLTRALRDAAGRGVGILLVEQHTHHALEAADRIYVMRRGSVILSGAAADFRGDLDRIEQAYLSADDDSAGGRGGPS